MAVQQARQIKNPNPMQAAAARRLATVANAHGVDKKNKKKVPDKVGQQMAQNAVSGPQYS